MRPFLCFAAVLLSLFTALQAHTQKNQREPLTDAESQQIAEAGIDPNARVKLYIQFIDEHVDAIKGLTNRIQSETRSKRLDNALQDFTALLDELDSNLDTFSDRHADIRVALKPLSEAAPRWLGIVRALAGEPGFDESRKEAIETCDEMADEAKRLLSEENEYFKQHPDEKGQDRAEPK
jgi:hypothetical protein